MPDDLLVLLDLTPAKVASLPARLRRSLLDHLLRWRQFDSAQRCLEHLHASNSRLVAVHDRLAQTYLAQGQPDRAVRIMRQRHALRICSSSQALEARAYIAAGQLPQAQALAGTLQREKPHLLLTWDLTVDVCLAAGDLEGAEVALRQREALRPGAAATALGLAHVWEARGDLDKALLWARTALARADRDGHAPSVQLLRLLESLYRATGQQSQSEATVRRLRQRQKQEEEALRLSLDSLGNAAAESESAPEGPSAVRPPPLPPEAVLAPGVAEVIAGAVELSPDERVRLDQALHEHFAHEAFLPGQADVVAKVLRGQSVLAVMPTGGGKSLCYQLAAQLLPGTTLVISPLIALMKDQLDGLPRRLASQATTLNSTLDGSELDARLSRAARGGYRLLYAAPERLRQRPFLHAMQQARVSLLVVDEAHCISLWGHDFRPDYRFIARAWQVLGQQREKRGALPIMAMTATATPRVRDDVQATLGPMHMVTTDLYRPNLLLEVRHLASEAEKKRALLLHCRQLEGSGIVYARSRRKCEELAEMLRADGMSAVHYHAGISDRAAAQDRFMCNKVRIVAATIAFGMGVDKADVRFIIHYDPPAALENYYQEAGRAGRDGLPARCILFHCTHDKAVLTRLGGLDVLQLEFLRNVYSVIKQRVGSTGIGLVAVNDLLRDLDTDETRLRVAIHFLETAGLLWRDFDLPRTASLTLRRDRGEGDQAFARLVEAARLRPGQTVPRDLLALAHESGIDPRSIERQLLTWADAGWLYYRGTGRDMLLALPDPPPGSQGRVAAMAADRQAGQEARIGEIIAYAKTTGCRQGYISTYFGGRPIEQCQACDNCLEMRTAASSSTRRPLSPSPASAVPGAATAAILQGVAELSRPLGRRGLARALQGASTSPVEPERFPSFGVLSSQTQESIAKQIADLEERGLLAHYKKGTYRLLRLTDEGNRCLDRYRQQHPTGRRPVSPPPEAPKASGAVEHLSDSDQALFKQLRAWRLEQARKMGLPPYCILHNSVLKRIAVTRPRTAEELLAIQGIGPHKLVQFGCAILELITGPEANGPGMTGAESSQ